MNKEVEQFLYATIGRQMVRICNLEDIIRRTMDELNMNDSIEFLIPVNRCIKILMEFDKNE